MPKVLAQAGTSLADVYDVEGSVAGVEQLLSRDVQLLHEMGQTIFSERISAAIRRTTTGAIAASAAWNNLLTDLPAGVTRILGVQVICDADRIDFCSVSISDGVQREIPIWIWDTTTSVVENVRITDDAAVANRLIMLPTRMGVFTPSLLVGEGQPQRISAISFRGVATAFGAGTVTATALIHIAFSEVGGVSSKGLPVPGW